MTLTGDRVSGSSIWSITLPRSQLVQTLERVAIDVARPAAYDVDKHARFPSETVHVLREVNALGAAVPQELGGGGSPLLELARMCTALSTGCAASGMVLAMHHIQVLSLARHHGGNREVKRYLERVAAEQRLIASVTSEVGPSGDMRQSVAAVQSIAGDGYSLEKHATTISYGAHADDLLITARKNEKTVPSDQVLVLAQRGQYELSDVGTWDTLGMRGTCSPGATVRARGESWQVLDTPFGYVATLTMVPVSHVLWGAVWLGIASDAMSRAQVMVRKKARANPGVVPRAAQKLTEVAAKLQMMKNEVHSLAAEHDALHAANDVTWLSSLPFALKINNLKLSASRLVVEITQDALQICGIEAYKNNSQFSVGRNLRDACSAGLMIHNDRIVQTNESLLLVQKGT